MLLEARIGSDTALEQVESPLSLSWPPYRTLWCTWPNVRTSLTSIYVSVKGLPISPMCPMRLRMVNTSNMIMKPRQFEIQDSENNVNEIFERRTDADRITGFTDAL